MPTAVSEEHPYASFIQRVKKPARYLGGEHGQTAKPWDQAKGRICLAFPDLYEVGMSHLGYKILYGILNRHPELLAERVYAPWSDMEGELRARDEPLRSLESGRALRDFDVVGFSLQFELTYTNVLLMLDLGGVPLRASDRGEDHPLVVCGGPTATHAECMAPFVDAFLIGDGELRTPQMVLLWSELKAAGVPRRERLRALAQLGGFYVPALYGTERDPETGFQVVRAPADPQVPFPVERHFVPDLDAFPFPTDGPVAATETVFDRVSVEIARGCTEGCRFCQAGMIYRPVRERSPQEILRAVVGAVKEGGYDEASLTSLSTADYSAIAPLVKAVSDEVSDDKVALSVSSLRAYGLSEDVLDDLSRVRASGLTFAPEAGTQRMRDVVNKNVTEEQLMETAERVFARGFDRMKLYFMIGLPTEEDEDVRGIVETGARAYQVGKKVLRRRPKVTVSVSSHVPKPHTPFQWCAMNDRETIRRKQGILRETARNTGVKLRVHDSTGSWLEGVLARGDRPLAEVIERAYRNGARFDSWDEGLRLDVWEEAFAHHQVDVDRYLETLPMSARLPWDHIDVGLEDGFLAKEYRKALSDRLSPPCGKVRGMFVHHTNLADAESDRRKLVCYDCGIACDLEGMREERLVSLRTLGAEAPRPAAPEATETQTRRPRLEAVDQGPKRKLRLAYRKVGRMTLSGHLDLVRILPRILRRAEVPLWYTEGFHPKPEMLFAPALPLGYASLAEHIDISVRAASVDGNDPEVLAREVLARLREKTFAGIHWDGAAVLGPDDPPLSKIVDEAVYVAGLPRHTLAEVGLHAPLAPGDDEAGIRAALAARVAERRAQPDNLVVLRTVKGVGKKIDVGKYLLDARVGEGADVLSAAGLAGRLVPVTLRLHVTGQGSCKAEEAVEALLGGRGLDARYVRAALLGGPDRRPPLDLPAFARTPRTGPGRAASGAPVSDAPAPPAE